MKSWKVEINKDMSVICTIGTKIDDNWYYKKWFGHNWQDSLGNILRGYLWVKFRGMGIELSKGKIMKATRGNHIIEIIIQPESVEIGNTKCWYTKLLLADPDNILRRIHDTILQKLDESENGRASGDNKVVKSGDKGWCCTQISVDKQGNSTVVKQVL